MKTQLLFLFMLTGYQGLKAQDSTYVTIKAGSSIRDILTTTDIYLSPQFINGNVFFRNGTRAIAMMNYNSLDDQMLFINPKGDTLALTDEKTIKFITLDKDTFYYNEGYIRLVASNSVVKLAEKQVWEVADIRKIGAQNKPSTTFSITSYSELTDRFGKSHNLLLNEDLVLRKRANYYFGDMYYNFIPAGKKHLRLLFPKQQNSITNYLKENKVNFDKKEDLEKIVQFLGKKL